MTTENRRLLTLLGVLVLVILLVPALGMGMMGAGMMRPGMMGWYGGAGNSPGVGGWGWGLAMGLGWLAMLAFWGMLIVAAALLGRWLVTTVDWTGAKTEDSALEVLKRRFAAGKITQEQYEQMRRVLEPWRQSRRGVSPRGEDGRS